MSNQLLQSMIFSVVIMGYLNAFFIKDVLKQNGYQVSFAGGYFNEVKDIFKLAKATPNRNDKVKYMIMGSLDIILTVSFAVLAVLFFKYFQF